MMKTCCKEWAFHIAPRQACPANQTGFEEAHACPSCDETYLVWFTRIGRPNTGSMQLVPLTIKPTQDIVQASRSMPHFKYTSSHQDQLATGR